ncbi:MAG: tetratricopeptide repeat protein [Bacteroidales bacterium]|nr:tetratricopeptide repeat protein [Bacteroidales bacterium]
MRARLFISILVLCIQIKTFAQNYTIERFGPRVSERGADVSASTKPRLGSNGKECALIKVLFAKKGASFLESVGDVENHTNEYWVYINSGSKSLTINTDSGDIKVLFSDFGIDDVETKTTYELKITNNYIGNSFSSSSSPSDFIKEANAGDPEAQCNLGKCYFLGQGTIQNYNLAFNWFHKAADKEHPEAQYYIGRCYYYGLGLPNIDYKQSVIWLERSANQENADAQYLLGVCYEKGQGVRQNQGLAQSWYERASKNGSQKAKQKL